MNDTPRTDSAAGHILDADEEHAQAFVLCAGGAYVYADEMAKLERENNALRTRVESASAIITELLARTAKCDCRESDDAVAAAMAWLHDHTP